MGNAIPLTDLDRRFLRGWGPHSANHALIVDFEPSRHPPFSLGELRRGAVVACRAFPAAGSRLVGASGPAPSWQPAPGEPFPLVVRAGGGAGERAALIREFVVADFPPGGVAPLRQLLCGSGHPPAWTLVTQAQCAVSDLPGLFLLVRRQLRAAAGDSVSGAIQPQRGEPDLRRLPRRRARRRDRTSVAVRTRGGEPSGRRAWGTLSFPRALHSGRATVDGFSWDDALIGAALEALGDFNRAGEAPDRPLAVEVRESIRARPLEGFGNGTASRLVRRPDAGVGHTNIRSVCRAVAIEVSRAAYHGVPRPGTAGLGGAVAAARRVLRGRRPSSSFVAAAPFTLMTPWPRWGGEALPGRVRGLELVSSLSPAYPVAFATMPFGDRVLVTMTWDPMLLAPKDSRRIAADFGRLVAATAPASGVARAGDPGRRPGAPTSPTSRSA